jgi:hypothetical protein
MTPDAPKPVMMPFVLPARPKNLYLVYGWKVGITERNLVMFEKGEEARELKLSLTVSGDGQKFFVGLHLATTEVTEGEAFSACELPDPHDTEALLEASRKLGMPQDKFPKLYVIAG